MTNVKLGRGFYRGWLRGALAVLVRSVGPMGLRTVHTGSVTYAPGQPQIPARPHYRQLAYRRKPEPARGNGC